ncbi:MAG: sigma 54-interacting transcriptional regulator [Deltaproteobacteria bacterium]|nr:sigma 54-interacting transcriptional regulator [Deltaproteobacteria bacterium]
MDERTRTILVPSPVEHLRSRVASVEVAGGGARGRKVAMGGFSLRLGSDPDNDLVLPDETVSRHHARLELGPMGYRLRDLGSKNGTFVGDLRVGDAILTDGCRFQLGSTPLRFRLGRDERDDEVTREHRLGRLVGRSLAMRRLFALLQRVAPSSSTVLVEGESGTGKELVAETLHGLSDRRDGPFEVFDCTTVPGTLMESHLFGHDRGAFTGAGAEHAGVLERADGGTLLVDEIGELPPELQVKLLRAIDRKEYIRLGSERRRRADVRILAATNRILEAEVEAGRFRADLFWRLAVVRVPVPALRHRIEDIPLLVEDLEDELGAGLLGERVPRDVVEAWQRLPWPGNVRELRNAVERALLLGTEETTSRRPPGGIGGAPVEDAAGSGTGGGLETFWRLADGGVLPFREAKARLVEGFEQRYWADLMARSGGNVTRAAAMGGIHRKSLEYLMKKLDLSRNPARNLP